MATGALTAASAVPVVQAERYSWPRAVVLHLVPGVLVMAGYLVLRSSGMPAGLALSTATMLIGVPVQLGYLIYARGRSTGSVVSFRRQLPRREFVVVVGSCLALAAGLYLWLAPFSGDLARHVFGRLPDSWFLAGSPDVSRTALVASLVVSLLVNGVVSPAVQELYFRGHLMPRLPVGSPLLATLASAGLFALQHLWQPHLVVVIFAVQLVVGAAVWRTRCLAVAIAVHSACNILAIGTTLFAVLAGA